METKIPSLHPPEHDRPLFALALRGGSMIGLAIMFAGVRLASQRGAHIVESMFFRQLFAALVAAVILYFGPGLSSVKTSVFGQHLSRTCIGLTGMILNFGAVILLPLPEATTLGFTMPIFATILSAVFLREHVGPHRWAAVMVGFLGVLIIFQPGSGEMHVPSMGVMVALAAAFVTAIVTILLRRLSRTEAPTTIAFWFATLSVLPIGVLMLRFAQPHDLATYVLLIGVGVIGGLAQILMTAALRYGSVGMVMPMDYSMIIWTAALGWLIWGYWPPVVTWMGAALIIASGLYIAWREHMRMREVRSARPPLIS